MRRPRTIVLSTLVVIAGLVLGTTTADAVSVNPIPRFSAGGWARESQLVADASGRATAVWQNARGVMQTSTFDGVTWTCPVTLPDSKVPSVDAGWTWDLGVADNGNAAFAGAITNEGVAVWTRPGPKGKWTKVRWADPNAASIREDHGPPTVALTGATAVVAWVAGRPGDGTLAVYGAQIPVGATGPIAVTTILSGEGVSGQNPEVAADANGNGFLMAVNGDANTTWLDQFAWPRGGTPTPLRRIDRVQSGRWSISAHANATGQLVAMWTETPVNGNNTFAVKVATGSVTSGITGESIWTSNEENDNTHALWSAIAPNGNVAMMSINQEAVIWTGLGNAGAGAPSLVPTWSGGAPSGQALTSRWEVTASDSQSWVAFDNDEETAFLAQVTPGGLRTVAQRANMFGLSAAVVRVGTTLTGAMMGEDTGSTRILTTLPNKVASKGQCK